MLDFYLCSFICCDDKLWKLEQNLAFKIFYHRFFFIELIVELLTDNSLHKDFVAVFLLVHFKRLFHCFVILKVKSRNTD